MPVEQRPSQVGMPEHQVKLVMPPEHELLTPDEIAQRIAIPSRLNPRLLVLSYFSQPRGCSTATGAAWGSLPWLEGKAHFQPWKYLQRYAKPLNVQSLSLIEQDQEFVGLKETPGGPNHMAELFDPLSILVEAGMPVKHMAVTLAARHPLYQFESILKFDTRRSTNVFLAGQEYLLHTLSNRYQDAGIPTVPFVAEMYCGHEADATRALFTAMGVNLAAHPVPDTINFKKPHAGVVWHEADPRIDPHYYTTVVADVVDRGSFNFPRPHPTDFDLIRQYKPPEAQRALWTQAVPRYVKYAESAAKFLRQKTGFRNPWFESEFLPQVRSDAKQHGAHI